MNDTSFKASPVPPRTLPGKGSSKSVAHLSPKLNDTVLSPSKSSTDIEPLEAIKSFLLITCVVVSKNTLLFADCFRLDSEPPNVHFTMHPPPTVFTSSGGSFFLILTTETAERAAMSIGLPALAPILATSHDLCKLADTSALDIRQTLEPSVPRPSGMSSTRYNPFGSVWGFSSFTYTTKRCPISQL